jgi:hypothetical protein
MRITKTGGPLHYILHCTEKDYEKLKDGRHTQCQLTMLLGLVILNDSKKT